jgi:RNAse (barnase) inhibitor barstar
MKEFVIDGLNFSTLEGFYDVISADLIPGSSWGRNLDAFNDILRGGFGTPDEGFKFIWRNSNMSREKLGYDETVRQLEKRLAKCHPDNRKSVQQRLEEARRHIGSTVFDWLVEIINDHGPNGIESQDNVILVLA